MEKENTPPSSHPELSLSLKRRFAALEREEVKQYSLVKVPKRTEQSNGPRAILKSGEETTTEETPAARFVETFLGLWSVRSWMKSCLR